MSMNLAKQSFSTAPEYFIAGTTVGIVSAVKEASAAVKAHGPVLLDSDGKVKPVTTSTTGSGDNAVTTVPTTGIYGIATEAAASGGEVVVYLTGEFFADSLALETGVTAADVEIALRNIGIFLK
jgi:hypothetical protein